MLQLLFTLMFLSYSFNTLSYTTQSIDDISRLNATNICDIKKPTSVEELRKILIDAKNNGLKISVAGKKHSQGGHTFADNCIVIDITKLNKIIALDTKNKIITVQVGVTWNHIQEYIHPYNLAIKVMQTVPIFTVGGSLSVNCHGRDPNYGPIIETIKAFRILCSDGNIRNVSRDENTELFTLAIGGYGLFGIITEVDIELTDNVLYEKEVKILNLEKYIDFIQTTVQDNQEVGLHYGQLSTSPYNFFDSIISCTHYKTLIENNNAYIFDSSEWGIGISRFGLRLKRQNWLSNYLASIFEWPAIIFKEKWKKIVCRNNAMQHPFYALENKSKHNSDLLQSYFIPLAHFVDFIKQLRKKITKNSMNILMALTRYIPANTESFLSYTHESCIEIVLFLNVKHKPHYIKKVETWTKEVIDLVLTREGTYYLPVQTYYSSEQLKQSYPSIDEFFRKKLWYDPQEIFVNQFYEKYAKHFI